MRRGIQSLQHGAGQGGGGLRGGHAAHTEPFDRAHKTGNVRDYHGQAEMSRRGECTALGAGPIGQYEQVCGRVVEGHLRVGDIAVLTNQSGRRGLPDQLVKFLTICFTGHDQHRSRMPFSHQRQRLYGQIEPLVPANQAQTEHDRSIGGKPETPPGLPPVYGVAEVIVHGMRVSSDWATET